MSKMTRSARPVFIRCNGCNNSFHKCFSYKPFRIKEANYIEQHRLYFESNVNTTPWEMAHTVNSKEPFISFLGSIRFLPRGSTDTFILVCVRLDILLFLSFNSK